MKHTSILICTLFVFAASGCEQYEKPWEGTCHSQNWTCRARFNPIGEQRDNCINEKLDHMSDADHTSSWSAELVKALHEVCAKMYPTKATK